MGRINGAKSSLFRSIQSAFKLSCPAVYSLLSLFLLAATPRGLLVTLGIVIIHLNHRRSCPIAVLLRRDGRLVWGYMPVGRVTGRLEMLAFHVEERETSIQSSLRLLPAGLTAAQPHLSGIGPLIVVVEQLTLEPLFELIIVRLCFHPAGGLQSFCSLPNQARCARPHLQIHCTLHSPPGNGTREISSSDSVQGLPGLRHSSPNVSGSDAIICVKYRNHQPPPRLTSIAERRQGEVTVPWYLYEGMISPYRELCPVDLS